MRIICTVKELVSIVRGCSDFRRMSSCSKCPFGDLCSNEDSFIESFVSSADVVEEEANES